MKIHIFVITIIIVSVIMTAALAAGTASAVPQVPFPTVGTESFRAETKSLNPTTSRSIGTASETTIWREIYPVHAPSIRDNQSMTFDSTRGVAVLFGGWNGPANVMTDTWEWDGADWHQRFPAVSPPAHQLHAMTFDSARNVAVLFGRAGTWEWDGINWTQRNSVNSPTPRGGHAMAYDSVRRVVVLFGGDDGAMLSDTWEWNGSDWLQKFPAAVPSRRVYHGMTYDSARGRVVLFGGFDNYNQPLDDTWEWDGSNWTQRLPTARPPSGDAALTYDGERQRVVRFGISSNTWEFDGTNWERQVTTTAPSARGGIGLAYDGLRQRIILFGGFDGSRLNDTWEYGASQATSTSTPTFTATSTGTPTPTPTSTATPKSRVFLPLILKRYPPVPYTPQLSPIENADGDGEYTIWWTEQPSRLSDTYTLQEATDFKFATSLRDVCTTAGQSCLVAGRTPGTYYYRVRGHNGWGSGEWSNTQSVTVLTPPTPTATSTATRTPTRTPIPPPTTTPTPSPTSTPHTPQFIFQPETGGTIRLADALTMASTPLLVPPPPPPSYKYWGAKWSPDGSRIAFFNNYGDTFIANWDGSIVQQLGRYGSVSNEQPAWSPSGDRIVVDKWDSSTQQSDLWSISVTDANLAVNLTNTPGVSEGYPVWSPRGDLIAYSRGGVWVMNADGTNQREIRASAGHPSWSPDGKRIVFYLASDGDSEIYTIDLDSGNLVKLTNNFEADYNPAWSPDGKSIAFSSSRAGGLDIYVMNSDGLIR
jgi:hypothetical protein